MWYKMVLLAFCFLPTLCQAQTRTVDGQSTGKYYNDVWKSWSNFPVIVYIDDEGNTYIKGGESLLMARGFLYPRETQKTIELLKKSANWAATAKQDKVEITKELGSFMKGNEYNRYGLTLTFFSANKGTQTDVILHLVDFENTFTKIDLYMNQDQVKQLIVLLEKIPQTLIELNKQKEKSDKFKGSSPNRVGKNRAI